MECLDSYVFGMPRRGIRFRVRGSGDPSLSTQPDVAPSESSLSFALTIVKGEEEKEGEEEGGRRRGESSFEGEREADFTSYLRSAIDDTTLRIIISSTEISFYFSLFLATTLGLPVG